MKLKYGCVQTVNTTVRMSNVRTHDAAITPTLEPLTLLTAVVTQNEVLTCY